MRAARAVLEYLKESGVRHIFGIPAGSVNAFFDELCELPELEPVVAKHEGAASYMAAAYAKYSGGLGVCIGCSGPGATNLVTGAANAMREHLPVLFLTGAVPVNTMGLNASQELSVAPIFESVTKYSVIVKDAKQLLEEAAKAHRIAVSGVPGPVHIAVPIDVQHADVGRPDIPAGASRKPLVPDAATIEQAARAMLRGGKGCILAGQGARGSIELLVELAELLQWPIMTTPQAKGLVADSHPLYAGIFGFAGHESASDVVSDDSYRTLLIVGSSLGETATNNYNPGLTKGRFVIQLDFDASVFNRKYEIDTPVLGDIHLSLLMLLDELKTSTAGSERGDSVGAAKTAAAAEAGAGEEYSTKNVLLSLQRYLPGDTRYTVDIGEFMSYVIHHMRVSAPDSYSINVHFGAMGSGIGSAIGAKLADPDRPVVCLTGDGCFFMHGMEILTAKEHGLPMLFIVMNNARLGMVYHGHSLQFKRTHPSFEQEAVNIAAMGEAMGIPSFRALGMDDLRQDVITRLMQADGPAILEVVLQDNNVPPMGDRVKFLSSFGK